MNSSAYQLDRLRAEIKPFRLHWFPRLRSTNDHAALLRKRGALYAPAVVLTSCQLAGRGRGDNSRWSAPGVITATFAFPIDNRRLPHQIPLVAGLAARNAVVDITGAHRIELKWPNDLLFEGRKLAGLLCERVEKLDLIGVGLNVNVDAHRAPAALRDRITSLSAITCRDIDMTAALGALARHLRRLLTHADEHPFSLLLREYDTHHALVGKRVTVTAGDGAVSGRCEGLDSQGRLLLRDRARLHRVLAGEVRVQ
jgi:BirA family biotin operon repressor/biotin-[acetyl-CoA-carboxylase] ligase